MIAILKLRERIPYVNPTLRQLPEADMQYIREGCAGAFSYEGVHPELAETIRYVLSSEGSLMRAQLGFTTMLAAGADRESARAFGVAVELFHTASLMFDDMPAMDNAAYRRGIMCVHKKFSEADATLGALALITQAYDMMFSLLLNRPDRLAEEGRAIMTECLGARGILSGQSADLHHRAETAGSDDVLAIAMGKTGTLLRLLLVMPAAMYGMPRNVRDMLEELAVCWGCGYQVLDDIKDSTATETDTGKTVRRDRLLDRPNYFNKAGRHAAWQTLGRHLERSGDLLSELVQISMEWGRLCRLQEALVSRAATFQSMTLPHPAES